MMRSFLIGFGGGLLALTPAAAQSPAEEEVAIQVEGQTKPQRASVAQFREAQRAFLKFRPLLAPASSLAYEIIASNKSGVTAANIDSIRLSLVSKDNRIPLVIDDKHQFVMPDLLTLGGDYRLFANAGKKPIYIAPRVFSPGTSKADLRLGDVRLTCQIGWAYYKSEIPIIFRAGFGLIGGCNSKRIALLNRLPKPLASVTMSDRGKTVPLPINPKFPNAYRVPIYDKKLSNDARIVAIFK
ncbi:MAG: hypothetical protein ACKVOJ_10190 [Sphingomonadaceae bacterium]